MISIKQEQIIDRQLLSRDEEEEEEEEEEESYLECLTSECWEVGSARAESLCVKVHTRSAEKNATVGAKTCNTTS